LNPLYKREGNTKMELQVRTSYPELLQPILKDFEYKFAIQNQDKNGKFMTDYSIIDIIHQSESSSHTIHFRSCLFVPETKTAYGAFDYVSITFQKNKITFMNKKEHIVILMEDYSPTLLAETIYQCVCV
jgi:hypothetical protein